MKREERFNKIINQLMEFDEIFLDFARMGRCVFSKSIPTACISYNKEGNEMGFFWNPDFFDESSDYKNMFVLCHEMLHIFLKHGRRGRKLENHRKANLAMDVSINHLLVEGFGFNRSMIEGWENLCWRDTVFKIPVSPQPCFESYYAIDDDDYDWSVNPLDDFNFEDLELPPELEDKIKESLVRIPGGCDEEQSFVEQVIDVKPPIKKPKFELVVRNVAKTIVKKTKILGDTWAKIDRRLMDVCPDLPVMVKVDEKPREDKYLCHFYIDNSGSCGSYIKRFAECANSLDMEVFEAKIFTFDTKVYELEKERGKFRVKGGGGTVFGCVVNHAETSERHPDVIFVLTDGYAETVKTKNPKKWHWLITENGTPECIRNAGKWWPLSQFE